MSQIKHESSGLSHSPGDSLAARERIFEMMQTYPATAEEKERSLGLFLRGSLLARLLAIVDLYRQIVDLPGGILLRGRPRQRGDEPCAYSWLASMTSSSPPARG